MSRKIEITGGVVCDQDTFYVLITAPQGEDDDRLIASGRLESGSITFRRRGVVEDLISVADLKPPFEEQFVGLTGDGQVVYFSEADVRHEQIPGAGFSSAGTKKLGRMTKITQIGDTLLALGYGGQAYMRTASESWRFLAGPRGREDGLTDIVYFCAAEHKGVLYFGGTETTVTGNLEAATAARRARIRTPDVAVIWAYDGAWRRVPFDHLGTVVAMLPLRGSIQIFTTVGRIIATTDFVEFNDLFAFDRKKSFWDIKRVADGIVVYFDGTLFNWTGEMQPFEPSLPIIDESFINISGHSGLLAAFSQRHIFKLEGEDWSEVTYTLS